MNYRDFFPRLLQHVPLAYFRIVRYYGLYSNRGIIPEEYLNKKEDETENKISGNWELLQVEKTGKNPLICNHCNKKKVYLYTRLKSKQENKIIIFKRIITSDKLREKNVA